MASLEFDPHMWVTFILDPSTDPRIIVHHQECGLDMHCEQLRLKGIHSNLNFQPIISKLITHCDFIYVPGVQVTCYGIFLVNL